MTLPSEATDPQDTPLKVLGNNPHAQYTQDDRQGIIDAVLHHGFGGILRKHARIVALQENQPFTVETDRGTMRGEAGDWIVTNHPDDDSSSDVWSISDERMQATYGPWDRPVITEVAITPPVVRIRSVIAELRAAGDGERGADRHASLAITKLEEAILWLNGPTVLGE
jgi:hypothetical protein